MEKVKTKGEYISKEKKVSTLGYQKLENQINDFIKLGLLKKVSKAYDTYDKNVDIDTVMGDITRNLGFDLADYSEIKNELAKRFSANRAQIERKQKQEKEQAQKEEALKKQESAKTQPEPVTAGKA